MTITEFLLARIAEDENWARMAGHGCGYLHEHNAGWVEVAFPDEHNARASYELGFIKRNGPARVLAECEAKRRIVAEHELTDQCIPPGYQAHLSKGYGCLTCHDWDGATEALGPCVTLAALAAVYATHPDYDEGWAS